MPITFTHKGNFNKTTRFLGQLKDIKVNRILDKYGRIGVQELSIATPKDTGVTASSWSYTISKNESGYSISWDNSSRTDSGIPIVILIQFGHGTRNGGYVQPNDFINPTMEPIFKSIAHDAWREVTKL